jgi:acyl-CoA thioester hydrolase
VKHRVRYHETDMQGIMFNSRYLEIIDVAMTEFIRDQGFDPYAMTALPFDPVLAHVDLTFVSPAKLDDVIDVAITCTRIGNSSFDLAYRLSRHDGVEIARATITYVNVDVRTHTSVPIPGQVRSVLEVSGA